MSADNINEVEKMLNWAIDTLVINLDIDIPKLPVRIDMPTRRLRENMTIINDSILVSNNLITNNNGGEIVQGLLHNIVHIVCNINNVQCTSRYGRYHNKKFKDPAEMLGIKVCNNSEYGWSDVILDKQSLEIAKTITNFLIKYSSKDKSENYSNTPKHGKTSTRKYVCPNCGKSFRATKDINVICAECKLFFIKDALIHNSNTPKDVIKTDDNSLPFEITNYLSSMYWLCSDSIKMIKDTLIEFGINQVSDVDGIIFNMPENIIINDNVFFNAREIKKYLVKHNIDTIAFDRDRYKYNNMAELVLDTINDAYMNIIGEIIIKTI